MSDRFVIHNYLKCVFLSEQNSKWVCISFDLWFNNPHLLFGNIFYTSMYRNSENSHIRMVKDRLSFIWPTISFSGTISEDLRHEEVVTVEELKVKEDWIHRVPIVIVLVVTVKVISMTEAHRKQGDGLLSIKISTIQVVSKFPECKRILCCHHS